MRTDTVRGLIGFSKEVGKHRPPSTAGAIHYPFVISMMILLLLRSVPGCQRRGLCPPDGRFAQM